MKLGGPQRNWWIYVGRSDYDLCRCIVICFGFIKDAPDYEIPWLYHWRVSTAALPNILFYQRIIRGHRFVYPCGIRIAGRYRTLPFH